MALFCPALLTLKHLAQYMQSYYLQVFKSTNERACVIYLFWGYIVSQAGFCTKAKHTRAVTAYASVIRSTFIFAVIICFQLNP